MVSFAFFIFVMKKLTFPLLAFCITLLSSCEIIGGIFKTGMYAGIFIVVFIVAIIIFIISKFSGKS
jgi:hypothetical protein